MLALSNRKSTFVLVSGFFGCCIFKILFKYYLTGHFLTRKGTIITIFNASYANYRYCISNTGKALQAKNPCVTLRGASLRIHFTVWLVQEPLDGLNECALRFSIIIY